MADAAEFMIGRAERGSRRRRASRAVLAAVTPDWTEGRSRAWRIAGGDDVAIVERAKELRK